MEMTLGQIGLMLAQESLIFFTVCYSFPVVPEKLVWKTDVYCVPVSEVPFSEIP